MKRLIKSLSVILLLVTAVSFIVGQMPITKPFYIRIRDLVDVATTAPTDNYVLIYDSATGLWGPEASIPGTVDTSGTPVDNDFAKFTDADTVEGRSYAETLSDLSGEATSAFDLPKGLILSGTVAKALDITATSSTAQIYIGGSGILASGEQAIYVNTPTETVATNAAWFTLGSTVTSGDLTGLRSRVTGNAASSGANVRGAYLEAKAGASKYAAMLEGSLSHADYSAGSVTVSGDVRGSATHISQGSGLNAANLYGHLITIQTRGDEVITTNDFGIMINNEAVGGNGRQMDAGIYLKSTNVSTPYGFAYGVDLAGAAGEIATADIRLSNGETISNITDGKIILSGTLNVNTFDVTLGGAFTTQNNGVTINAVGAARTLTLNESLVVGDGNDGTITYSGASKTLTVEDTSLVNQDLTSDASPTFATITTTSGSGGDLRIYDSDESHYTSITQAAIAGNLSLVLPAADGDANDVFYTTDGAGGMGFATATSLVSAATTSAAGKSELATTAETTTGTDTARAVTPDGLAGSVYGRPKVSIQVYEYDVAPTTGDHKAYFVVPEDWNGFDLVSAEAHVFTASGAAGPFNVMVHNDTDAADMLSTAITIDDTELDSSTAAVASVVNGATDDVVTGDEIRIDIDDVGDGAARGLEVRLVFEKVI